MTRRIPPPARTPSRGPAPASVGPGQDGRGADLGRAEPADPAGPTRPGRAGGSGRPCGTCP